MNSRTLATLRDLENANWFSKVGVKDAQKAIVLPSWEEAISHCASGEWEDLCLEATNQYCERLAERSKEQFNRWNDVAAVVKTHVGPLVERKIAFVVKEFDLPKVFADTVHWDMIHLCMEAEFADVYPPSFYASQGYWYIHGHFPCGWQGDFPNGTLIVY